MGKIHSIETLGLVDGPGIRVVVFMQGCPLRCIFCHNPDTWDLNGGYEINSIELFDIIKRYKPYFNNNGGVTFSGGEPLLQKDFLLEILKLCKENNIHTCLDTSGVGSNYDEILKYVDLVILDIKAIDKKDYSSITSVKSEKFFEFLSKCQELNKKLWLRQVIIPNINDNLEYINSLYLFISKLKNVEKVELLPYHNKAISKYEQLKISYKLLETPNMDIDKCKHLNDTLNDLLGL